MYFYLHHIFLPVLKAPVKLCDVKLPVSIVNMFLDLQLSTVILLLHSYCVIVEGHFGYVNCDIGRPRLHTLHCDCDVSPNCVVVWFDERHKSYFVVFCLQMARQTDISDLDQDSKYLKLGREVNFPQTNLLFASTQRPRIAF